MLACGDFGSQSSWPVNSGWRSKCSCVACDFAPPRSLGVTASVLVQTGQTKQLRAHLDFSPLIPAAGTSNRQLGQ